MKGAWWAAAVQPVLLGFGAILTTFNIDEVINDLKPSFYRTKVPLTDEERAERKAKSRAKSYEKQAEKRKLKK